MQKHIDAFQEAIDAHKQALGLEAGNGPEVDLFHLLACALEWCDAWNLDFDSVVSQAREEG